LANSVPKEFKHQQKMDGAQRCNLHMARMGGGGGSTILTRGTKATPTQNKQQQKLGQYVFKELWRDWQH
jgi:hypothetical protein